MSDKLADMGIKDPRLSDHATGSVQVRTAVVDAYTPQAKIGDTGRSDAATSTLTERLFSTVGETLMPGAVAISARAAQLGLTGQLHVDAGAYRRQLASMDSPVAQTLAQRMTEMKEAGWQILKPTSDAHPGIYSPGQRRIYAQIQGSMLSHIAGLDASPIKKTLPIIAHEVAHHNGVLIYGMDDMSSLETRILKQRSIEGETISMLTETHIAGQLSVKNNLPWDVNAARRVEEIKGGTLGEYIAETHYPKDNPVYVRRITNNLIGTVFSDGPIDASTGKVKAFDLAGLYGRDITSLDADPMAGRMRQSQDYLNNRLRDGDYRSSTDIFLHSGESEFRSAAAHLGKGVLALGALAMMSDIGGAFEESTAAGVGRTAKTGIEWGGYSAGAALANYYVKELAVTRPTIATVPVMALGFIGAYVADRLLGERVEATLRGR